jgi:hypothetical protein
MDRLVKGNPERARLPKPEQGKTQPVASLTCPHSLASWKTPALRTASLYPDGAKRPAESVGGRLRRKVAPCTQRPGHHLPQDWNGGVPTPHQTPDGRTWE